MSDTSGKMVQELGARQGGGRMEQGLAQQEGDGVEKIDQVS